MTYVNGAIIPVKDSDKKVYSQMALAMAELFKKHGALQVFESWGSDIPEGVETSFPKAVKLEAGESVVLSWIVWPSKEAREAGMKTLMSDPVLLDMDNDRPFAMDRLIHGGFDTIVQV